MSQTFIKASTKKITKNAKQLGDKKTTGLEELKTAAFSQVISTTFHNGQQFTFHTPPRKKTDQNTQSIVHLPTFAILRFHPRKLTWNPKHWWFGSMFLLFQEITFRFQLFAYHGNPQSSFFGNYKLYPIY